MKRRLSGTLLGEGGEIAGRPGPGPVIHSNQELPYSVEPPTGWLRQILPVETKTVAAGATGFSQVQPQEIFKVRKLNIPDPGVAAVYLTGVSVGQQPQFVNPGQVDVRCLTPDAVSTYLDFSTGQVGNTFRLDWLNGSAGDVTLAPMAVALIAI